MNDELIKIDWKVFGYRNCDNVQSAFQMLTEQIFCYEYDKPFGIYRFYNQPYIETMPVSYGNDVIGFQSKYFDESSVLSSKKDELIAAINGAHKKYPEITKLIFYINKEPTSSTLLTKIAPTYIEEIEKFGNELGIQIEWIGLNQLTTILMRPEMEYIREYFFSPNAAIKNIIKQICDHSQNIFNSINDTIQYKDNKIIIQHDLIDIDKYFKSNMSFLFVHGNGGSGKSALIKRQFEEEKSYPVWLFRATDFDVSSMPEFIRKFGDYSFDKLLIALDDIPNKICIIDSAEKVFTISYRDTLINAIKKFVEHKWHIIFTIRTEYLADFQNEILKTSNVIEHYIHDLTYKELEDIEKKYNVSLPTDMKIRGFLCNLFYLKLFLSNEKYFADNTLVEFLDTVWKQIICDSKNQHDSLNVRRGKMMVHLVLENANKGSYYFTPDNEDWDAITSLKESGIIQYDDIMCGYFVCHDVYEEVVLQHIISQAYINKKDTKTFFDEIGNSLVMRKAFRTWLKSQFSAEMSGMELFLLEILTSDNYPFIWKDEILISLLNENSNSFKNLITEVLQQNDYILLVHALKLLNTACKVIDDDFTKKIFTKKELFTENIYRFTRPYGNGWNVLISFIFENLDKIQISQESVSAITNVLYTWTIYNHNGATTQLAGKIALYIYQNVDTYRIKQIYGGNVFSNICNTILNSSIEIHSELSEIFEDVISEKKISHREKYTELCQHLLSDSYSTGMLCTVDPDLVINLAKLFWLENRDETDRRRMNRNLSSDFGLREETEYMCYPASAFQTPILQILVNNPTKAYDFIIDLFNKVNDSYINSELNIDSSECSEIVLYFPDGTTTNQIISDRIWKMYRGSSVSSNLLESILMALERSLLMKLEMKSKDVERTCKYLLMKSHSAAITAVITSLTIAYPNELFQIACILLHTPKLFDFDYSRVLSENECMFYSGIAKNKPFDNERERTNKLEFRKHNLEDIIVEYQTNHFDLSEHDFEDRLTCLYSSIDEGFALVNLKTKYEKFALYRMDLRKMKPIKTKSSKGEECIALTPDFPEELLKIRNANLATVNRQNKYLKLITWGRSRFGLNIEKYSLYEEYETKPETALEETSEFLDEIENTPFLQDEIMYVYAVLLRDFQSKLNGKQILMCCQKIMDYLHIVADEQMINSCGDGTASAISMLPILLKKYKEKEITDDPALILLMLMCSNSEQGKMAIDVFREKIWGKEDFCSKSLLALFVILKPEYDKVVEFHSKVSKKSYFKRKESLIKSLLWTDAEKFPDISKLNSNELLTLNEFLPTCSNSFEFMIISQSGDNIWKEIFCNNRRGYDNNRIQSGDLARSYINWLAKCLLVSSHDYQEQLIDRLFSNISISENFASLLNSLIFVEDRLKEPQSFWIVWEKMFNGIEKLCLSKKNCINNDENECEEYVDYDMENIIMTYLFAIPDWVENFHEWHSLSRENSHFFLKAADTFGAFPVTLYSIAFILNTVGYQYLDDGVIWLSKIIKNNSHLMKSVLKTNTIYYIEEYMHRFINYKRPEIQKSRELRNDVISILDFLVVKESTCGYMLREDIA